MERYCVHMTFDSISLVWRWKRRTSTEIVRTDMLVSAKYSLCEIASAEYTHTHTHTARKEMYLILLHFQYNTIILLLSVFADCCSFVCFLFSQKQNFRCAVLWMRCVCSIISILTHSITTHWFHTHTHTQNRIGAAKIQHSLRAHERKMRIGF